MSTFSVKTTFPVQFFIQFVLQPIARSQIGSQNFDMTPTSTSEDRFHLWSWKSHDCSNRAIRRIVDRDRLCPRAVRPARES